MSNLDKAILIATEAHAGQVDKAGQPYILHPLRLMLKFQSEVERIVAIMHDVVEDSDITLDNLKSFGFSSEVVNAIDCLTKKTAECYDDFISRISSNELAIKIKIEDIKDNMDLTRLNQIDQNDIARIERYHRVLQRLTN
jgi:(p)ppGpp synthase/HD superfamily hydrolase